MKKMPALIEKLKAMNISEEEGTRMGMKVGLGMMFHQMIDIGGCKWQYSGDGVQYGDADKEIFRYQPKGSQTWRVIYADGRLNAYEDHFVHRLAKLLRLEHEDLIEAKLKVKRGGQG